MFKDSRLQIRKKVAKKKSNNKNKSFQNFRSSADLQMLRCAVKRKTQYCFLFFTLLVEFAHQPWKSNQPSWTVSLEVVVVDLLLQAVFFLFSDFFFHLDFLCVCWSQSWTQNPLTFDLKKHKAQIVHLNVLKRKGR